MKKKKLRASKEEREALERMRNLLSDLKIEDDREITSITAGACGDHCMASCSYWCESYCAGCCDQTGYSVNGCAYKAVCPAAPFQTQ